ncbi:MAG: hypothetical protein RHS_5989 [Robinsoniella sp. RHS]|nr:MAG: hypothetical protein RHS_5989 [Robinsoniella sp. RHS]
MLVPGRCHIYFFGFTHYDLILNGLNLNLDIRAGAQDFIIPYG